MTEARQSQTCRWTRSNTLVAVVVGGLLLSLPWFQLNIEPSVPLGLYHLHAVRAPLTHGMLVVLPVPVSVQRWHVRSTPLLKPVAAVAGDVVCVENGTLYIGTEPYGQVHTEAEGEPLPHMTGCLMVREGEVFVASKGSRSLDSRYFGPVRVQDVTAWATPVLLWR
jgi:conjugative transfer signal peptidase TraF